MSEVGLINWTSRGEISLDSRAESLFNWNWLLRFQESFPAFKGDKQKLNLGLFEKDIPYHSYPSTCLVLCPSKVNSIWMYRISHKENGIGWYKIKSLNIIPQKMQNVNAKSKKVILKHYKHIIMVSIILSSCATNWISDC